MWILKFYLEKAGKMQEVLKHLVLRHSNFLQFHSLLSHFQIQMDIWNWNNYDIMKRYP